MACMYLSIFDSGEKGAAEALTIDAASLYCAFEQVTDGRKKKGKRYSLPLLLTLLRLQKTGRRNHGEWHHRLLSKKDKGGCALNWTGRSGFRPIPPIVRRWPVVMRSRLSRWWQAPPSHRGYSLPTNRVVSKAPGDVHRCACYCTASSVA